MSQLKLGHRLARELARRGNWRSFFATARYRELRQIDSVEDLAEFLDRTGYRRVRASTNVEEVAGDIVDQRHATRALLAGMFGLIAPVVALVFLPLILLWKAVWADDSGRAGKPPRK